MNNIQSHADIINQILDFIYRNDNFLISAHVNADGDAYASVVAIHLLLESLNKKSVMVLHDRVKDARYQYLTGFDKILSFSENTDWSEYLTGNKIESAIVLDVPSFGRLGDVAGILPLLQNTCKIDHHPMEDKMGTIEWVNPEASSTTAMVYEIFMESTTQIDQQIAKALYTGILYDTGRFSFANTTSRDYYIASEMVALGVKPAEITNAVFFENSFEALKTIGKGLHSLENYLDGVVNTIYLSYQDLEDQDQTQIEELANYSVAIRGGEVGMFIREIKPNFHKISLRSKNQFDVNKVAKAFNGGGHKKAAGCRIEGTKSSVIYALLDEIQKQF